MATRVEQRTIDIIPHDERHGRVRDLFTIWFGSNILPLTIYTGALAYSAFGLGFWAGVTAIVLGNLGGAIFMALHSIQGPKLGVPQMIQSRGQFGSVGAVLPVTITVIMYLGFFASNLFFGGETINQLSSSITLNQGQVITAILGLVVVIFGYSLIHFLNKIATVVLGAIMAVSIIIIATDLPSDFFTKGAFHWAGFISTVSFAALWQLAYAPYVSDYSERRPRLAAVADVLALVQADRTPGRRCLGVAELRAAGLADERRHGASVATRRTAARGARPVSTG